MGRVLQLEALLRSDLGVRPNEVFLALESHKVPTYKLIFGGLIRSLRLSP